ncbi:MAG: hypothetical protein HQL56_18260 [Magnetococcales bacterium]|nr:hypothetical protein [Magnetococcales bacterium]
MMIRCSTEEEACDIADRVDRGMGYPVWHGGEVWTLTACQVQPMGGGFGVLFSECPCHRDGYDGRNRDPGEILPPEIRDRLETVPEGQEEG